MLGWDRTHIFLLLIRGSQVRILPDALQKAAVTSRGGVHAFSSVLMQALFYIAGNTLGAMLYRLDSPDWGNGPTVDWV
jgi:hypothetical protein